MTPLSVLSNHIANTQMSIERCLESIRQRDNILDNISYSVGDIWSKVEDFGDYFRNMV